MVWKNGVQKRQRNSVEDLIRQHLQDIREVLLQLGRFDLIASLKKAQFFVKEVEFCGHLLSGGKRHPAKGNLVEVQKWGKPNTITGLRAFLGFANYYSGYVRDNAGIVSPHDGATQSRKARRQEGIHREGQMDD